MTFRTVFARSARYAKAPTLLAPSRRARERAVLPIRNRIGELALRQKFAWNVLVVGGVIAEPGLTVVGIKNDYRLVEVFAHDVDRADEIGVSANQDEDIGFILKGIHQHCGRDVDIRALLFKFDDANHAVLRFLAGFAGFLVNRKPGRVLAVETLDDLDQGICREGLKIDLLAVDRRCIVGVCLDGGGKVTEGDDFVVFTEHRLDQENGIKPFVWRTFDGTVVEVVSVEKDADFLAHFSFFSILQGPQPEVEALHRLDRVWRLDEDIIAKTIGFRKGASKGVR